MFDEEIKEEKPMCGICLEEESEYEYRLINGMVIPVCKRCGRILYMKNIGEEYHDPRLQLISMIEYVKFAPKVKKKKLV